MIIPVIILCLACLGIGIWNNNVPVTLAGGFGLVSCSLWILCATVIVCADSVIRATLLGNLPSKEEDEE